MKTISVTAADFPLTINLTAPSPPSALAIKVSGNQFVDQYGKPLRLKGVNCSGLEGYAIQNLPWMYPNNDTTKPIDPWAGSAPNFAAIKTWPDVNLVRIPLNQASWLGQTVYDYPSGAARNADPSGNYKATVKAAVDGATAAGLYVILDLHLSCANAELPGALAPVPMGAVNQNAMADADHSIAFWTSVASFFKSYPNVIFDLFNEPYMDLFVGILSVDSPTSAAAWKIWRDGGTNQQLLPYQGSATGGSALVRQNWQSAGMQALLNTVRAAGATNVILAGGLSYAQYMGGWATYAPVDPLKQLGAAWHAYPSASNNTQPGFATSFADVQAIKAAGYPVFAGECGDFTAAGAATWFPVLLPWLTANDVGACAWTWNTWGQAANNLILDAAGTPTPGEGTLFKPWIP